jgi:membrane protein DedA with SNARE-associated domain
MLALLALTGNISGTVIHFINHLGYVGIFILMIIESAGIPIPSEIIMTYGGFMASHGGVMQVLFVAAVGALGTGLGSIIGYGIGALGGKPFVERYGKYFGIDTDKMLWAERWFCKYGEYAVIYTRLLPVVRTIVNVPAGLLSMDIKKFIAYSIIGAFPWCLILASVGYILGARWRLILRSLHLLSYIVIAVVAVLIIIIVVMYILLKKGIIKRETMDRYLGFLMRA